MTPDEALQCLSDFADRHAAKCLQEYEDALLLHGATRNEIENALAFVREVLAKDKAKNIAKAEALLAAFRPKHHHGNGSLNLLARTPSCPVDCATGTLS